MIRMSDLRCTDTGLPCSEVWDQGRCFCLPCNRYSYVVARIKKHHPDPTSPGTKSCCKFATGEDSLVFRHGEYLVVGEFDGHYRLLRTYVNRAGGSEEYDVDETEAIDTSRGRCHELFLLYAGIPYKTALRAAGKYQLKTGPTPAELRDMYAALTYPTDRTV